MADNIFFVSGLPRSGSTLLMNMLGQNPNHYVTPTSGMIELFCRVRQNWKHTVEFRSEGLDKVRPRVMGAMKGVLHGYFENELSQGKIVFDKSRGWPSFIEDLEGVLGRKIKIISTVRDVRDIVSSFEKLYRKRGIEYDYPIGEEFFRTATVEGRAQFLLNNNGVVGMSIARFRDAIYRGLHERLVIIPYKSLTENPKETMKRLHEVLELDPFEYDPSHVEQVTQESDLIHGLDLHVIRPEVKSPPKTSENLLPANMAEMISNQYKDIQKLAGVI